VETVNLVGQSPVYDAICTIYAGCPLELVQHPERGILPLQTSYFAKLFQAVVPYVHRAFQYINKD